MKHYIKKIGYRFRVYPQEMQEVFLNKHFGCCRFIYNYLLNLREESYKKNKTKISGFALKREISKLKQIEDYKWLKEVNSQSLQESALDLEKGYRRFFKKLSTGKPRFKKKLNRQTFKVPQNFKLKKSKRENYFLYIPKLKTGIRINIHRKIIGEIKQLTISKDPSGAYYASFSCEVKEEVVKRKDKKNKAIGIDLGLTSFMVTSDGKKTEAPKFLRKLECRLASKYRSLSRKKKYSCNWNKNRKEVAVLHEKIANQRKDFIHKLSFELVDENQDIYLEDLNVKGMMRNRHLSKSISDASWGEFGRQLKYKAVWMESRVIQIGRFEPSSKLCSVCGSKNKKLKLHHRVWQCKHCLTKHDRDISAAKNILKIGQGMSELKPVEKSTAVFSLKRRQVGSVKQEPVSRL